VPADQSKISDSDCTFIALGGNLYTFPEMIAAIPGVPPTPVGFSVEPSNILFASRFALAASGGSAVSDFTELEI
jgi:hypothetical protein